jgi:uncharacterized protein YbaP (TraB family)
MMMTRATGILLLLLAYTTGYAQPKKHSVDKDGNTLLWQISGNGLQKPSYLFGTFHLMCKDDIHFSNPLKQAMLSVDTVYMELKMDDPSAIASVMEEMKMKGGQTLKDFYTDSQYQRIENFFNDSLHLPINAFQYYKPYFLVAAIYPLLLPCKNVSGVEDQLVKLAKEDNKTIKGLETMEFQSSVFDSIPYSEQAKDLLRSVDSMDQNRKEFTTMLNVYKHQQIDKIQELFEKSEFGIEDHEDLLLNDRNRNWVKQLKLIMQKGAVFVAVGAGHLVGQSGLIALLRKEGYKVQPLKN